MPEVPERLQDKRFRFVKIQKKKKGPFEKGWQDYNNYKWNEEEFKEWDGNYGVVCGFGDLTVIDADSEVTEKAVEENLPSTFTIETGSGGKHYYFICEDIEKPIRLKQEEYGDLGDVQYEGKQVVGPGSLHPSGNTYKMVKDEEIKKTSVTDIKSALSELIRDKDAAGLKKEEERKKREKDLDFDLNIKEVVDTSGLEKRGNEYQGPHPVHGSRTKKNFCVNPSKNVWHCFRKNCNSGGGPLSWIAVKEGIISCSEAQPGALSGDKFKKVLEIAKEKYDLDIDLETTTEDVDAPDGWNEIVAKIIDSNTTKMEAMHHVAEKLIEKHNFKTTRDNRNLWVFRNPVYENKGEQKIEEEIWSNIPQHVRTQDVNQVKEQIKGKTQIPRPRVAKKPHLIPVENGWYNINTDELQDPDPDTFITNHVPIKYDPEADCPEIKKFIKDVVEDESVPVIQEMFGYCLYRNYPIAKAFMFLGEGKNGKSTLLNLLRTFIGEDNCVSPSLQKLIRNEHAKARLYGKLANIHGDLSDKVLKHSGNFKMLTGQDMVEGRHLYQEGFEFKNYAKLIYSANELPETYDTTDAFFRRWIIVEFPYKFTDKKNDGHKNKDPQILDKITTEEEMSGLFNWAVEGLKRVLENGKFSTSAHTEEIKEKWMSQTNPIEIFIEKYCEFESQAEVPKDDFQNAVNKFAQKNGAETKKKAQITKKLAKTVPSFDTTRPRIDGNRENCYKGIVVTENSEYSSLVRVVRGKYEKSSAAVNMDTYTNNHYSEDSRKNPDQSDQGGQSKIYSTLEELENQGSDSTVFFDDLLNELEENGMDREEAEDRIDQLIQDGKIFEPKPGQLKTT